MPKFLFTYHGMPDIQGPEDGARHMAAWKNWNAGLGEAVLDPGYPVGQSITVTSKGVINDGGANPVSGVTVIGVDTLDAAIQMAKSCPHLRGTGTIEIAEIVDLEM